MSKADNYNKYNYDQASGEKYTGQRRYTIRGLATKSRPEIWHQEVDEGR